MQASLLRELTAPTFLKTVDGAVSLNLGRGELAG